MVILKTKQGLGGFDLSPCSDDEELPYDAIPRNTNAGQSTLNAVIDMARKDRLTIRQLYTKYAGARGQRTLVGTPKAIADEMEAWFRAGAVDGFLVQPAALPGGLDDFVSLVVPELQRRGIFRHEYTGSTLRDHLELDRSTNRFLGA